MLQNCLSAVGYRAFHVYVIQENAGYVRRGGLDPKDLPPAYRNPFRQSLPMCIARYPIAREPRRQQKLPSGTLQNGLDMQAPVYPDFSGCITNFGDQVQDSAFQLGIFTLASC